MLNVPLLIGTLIALVVLGPAAYCWHSYRMSWTEEAILQEAERLAQEADPANATVYFHRYLQLHPDDADVRVRLAETFDKATQNGQGKSQAIILYYRALGTAPADKQRDLRCRLADLLIEVSALEGPGPSMSRSLRAAEAQARELLTADPKDPQGRRLLALALDGQLRSAAAAGRHERASEGVEELKKALAVEVVEELEKALAIKENAGSVELSSALARVYRDQEQLSDEDFSRGLAPIYQGEKERLGEGLSGVVARIERAGKRPPGDELTRILAKLPGDRPQGARSPAGTLSFALGGLYADKPRLSADERRTVLRVVRELLADDVMDQMVAAGPKNADALLARCRYRMQYGLPGDKDDLQAALNCGHDNLAVHLVAAEQARREAVDVQRKGASADEMGKHLNQACKYYERAIEIAPRDDRAYLGLGEIHLAQGETDRAIQTWRQVLEKGNRESIWLNSRLAEVLIAVGRPDEAWIPKPDPNKAEELKKAESAPIHRLRLAIEKVALTSSQAARVSLERSLDLLEAKWFLTKGHYVQDKKPVNGYAEAIPRLRRVVAGEKISASEITQAFPGWMLLGKAYAALARWDEAAGAFEEAAKLQPRAAQLRVTAAKAWIKAGRLDLAVQQQRLALAAADDPEVQLELAETEFARQARLSGKERNWDLFKAAIEELKKPQNKDRLDEAWRVPLLEAAHVTAELPGGSPGAEDAAGRDLAIRRAKDLLDNAQKDYPDSAKLFALLVGRYEGLECKPEADHALEELARLSGGSAEAWLLRAQLLSHRNQHDEARRVLREGMEKLAPEGRAALEAALPNISLAAGERERAQKELLSLYEKDPSNVGLMSRLADLALQMNRLADLRRWESKLQEVEGENGRYRRYYRAARLLQEARETVASAGRTGDPEVTRKAAAAAGPLVQEASKLCAAVRDERPDWPRVHVLSGWAFELQGRFEQAVSAYHKALDLGGEAPAVYERLIPLLNRLNRFDEADRYLARLKEQGRLSQNLLPYEISAAERQGGLPQAIEAARRGVETQPGDAMARIWYGQTLLADGQEVPAEAEFKQAVELAPADARTHLALFNFYVRTQRRQPAEQTLQALVQKAQLSKLGMAYQLGVAHERLGDLWKAEEKYREADKLAEGNTSLRVAIKFRLASLLRQRRLDGEAEKTLREILELAPESDAARQSLLGLLAQRALATPGQEGQDEWQDIQQLLQQSGSADKGFDSSQRLQAVLALRRGGADDLKKAQQLLEKMVEAAQGGDVDVDRFFLARVYAAQSEPCRADAAEHEKLKADAAEYEKLKADAREYEKLKADPERLKKLRADAERYQKIVKGKDLDKADRRLVDMARQYTAGFAKSRQQFLTLVARDEPNPFYLASYIDLLLQHAKAFPQQSQDEATRWRTRLEMIVTQPQPDARLLNGYFALLRRHDLQDEADRWLTKLEKSSPDSLHVLALRVLWLRDRGRASEIEPLVEQVAERLSKKLQKDAPQEVRKEAQFCLDVGNVYSAVEQHPAAERWYRRLAALLPEGIGPLAISLQQQGRVTEAIRVCLDAARADSSPRPAVVLVRVLTSGQATKADFELAEPLLSEAVEEYKDNTVLLWAVGNVRIMQDRYDDAVKLYRQALALDPKNPDALNNLATLLSEESDTRVEALQLVERAIQLAGPTPALLDTKGTALIYQGKPHEAIPVLERAASSLGRDPRFPFHLAAAYYRAGQTAKAREVFHEVGEGDLKKQILTKKDQELLVELQQKLLQ